jgi:hypothetical protein
MALLLQGEFWITLNITLPPLVWNATTGKWEEPADNWGELRFCSAAPEVGAEWTDDGARREQRHLKSRPVGEWRRVLVPPPLTRLLRLHLEKFGTGPGGRVFSRHSRGRAGVDHLPPHVGQGTPYRADLRRICLSPGQARLRPAARVRLDVAQRRCPARTSGRVGRAQRRRPAQGVRQVHRRSAGTRCEAAHAPHQSVRRGSPSSSPGQSLPSGRRAGSRPVSPMILPGTGALGPCRSSAGDRYVTLGCLCGKGRAWRCGGCLCVGVGVPGEFLADEEAARYGRYGERLSRPVLEKLFFLDDDGSAAPAPADDIRVNQPSTRPGPPCCTPGSMTRTATVPGQGPPRAGAVPADRRRGRPGLVLGGQAARCGGQPPTQRAADRLPAHRRPRGSGRSWPAESATRPVPALSC